MATQALDNQLEPLATHVREFLEHESSGHDFYHAERVLKNALYIQQHEGGDDLVIGAAALVHDICRPWEKKTGKLHFSPEALEIIHEVLVKSKIPQDKIQPILDVVAEHDIYDWTAKDTSKSVEVQVVQDADNLDAMGAIGIGRTFAFGGATGLQMYVPGETFDFSKDFVEDPNHRTTTIAHFYEKLLKLQENMNTKVGKRLGAERHKIMENFVTQFLDEWNAKFD